VFGVIACSSLLGPWVAVVYRLAALLSDRWGRARRRKSAVRLVRSAGIRSHRLAAGAAHRGGLCRGGRFHGSGRMLARAGGRHGGPRSRGILLAAAAGALGVKLGGVLHEEGGIEYRPQWATATKPMSTTCRRQVGLIWRALVLWMFLIGARDDCKLVLIVERRRVTPSVFALRMSCDTSLR
jgi:adenosylcobinamide-phosphate synthase